jgi:anti-anti-sigma factor
MIFVPKWNSANRPIPCYGAVTVRSWTRNQSCATLLELMQPTKLDIMQQSADNGSLVARLTGKLSLETVNNFLQEMRPIAAEKLVLDMSGISYLDSAGVGALVQLFVHRRGQTKKMAVAALTTQGAAVLQVAGLTKLLPVFSTVEEASA